MSKVFVGGISPEGEHILRTYLDKFMPEAVIEPLKAVGIKGKMRNHAKRPDVVLVIIDEALYNTCVGYVDDVLSMAKVHKYINDDGLRQFLIRWFGKLDELPTPDELLARQSDSYSSSSGYSTIKEEDDFVISSEDDPLEDSELESKVADLQTKLAQSELMVKQLSMQLEDSKADSDVSAFIARIKELENTIGEKDKELQDVRLESVSSSSRLAGVDKQLEDLNRLQSEIREAKDNYADLEHKYATLEKERDAANAKLATAESELSEMVEAQSKLEEVTNSLKEMTERCARLESSNSDSAVLQEQLKKVQGVQEEADRLKDTIADKESEIDALKVDVESKTKKCNTLKEEIKELNTMLDEKEVELSDKTRELEVSRAECEELKTRISDLNDKVADLNDSIKEFETKVQERDSKILTLEQKATETENSYKRQIELLEQGMDAVDDKDNEIVQLNSTIENYKQSVISLEATISDLKMDISSKEGEIEAFKKRETLLKTNAEKSKESLNSTLNDNLELSEKARGLEDKVNSLQRDLSRVNAEFDSAKQMSADDLEAKNTEIESLNVRISKYEIEVKNLQSKLAGANADSEMIDKLNQELLEERRKAARLQSELSVLQESSDLIGSSDSMLEINRLKNRIAELESSQASNVVSEDDSDSSELSELREKYASLEVDLLEKTETLDEYMNGVFGQLANIALPKVAYDVKLPVPESLNGKFVVVASASLESNLSVYQLLKRTCVAKQKVNYLVVDLVTDTNIDVTFGVEKINSPINWLSGSITFGEFISPTKLPNVRVLSTALAYMNDLSLLMVDWSSRLQELQGYADVVVINVGCLNNFVSKMLYASFSSIMDGQVIVKATPVNLRTAILTITGFKSLNNTLVSCVNFDANASKILYQKLVGKLAGRNSARILKDTDILDI